ncbi:MAG TPA: hypothetical protein VIK32_02045, partial [Candidatus Limnocylindrales bacterium]
MQAVGMDASACSTQTARGLRRTIGRARRFLPATRGEETQGPAVDTLPGPHLFCFKKTLMQLVSELWCPGRESNPHEVSLRG